MTAIALVGWTLVTLIPAGVLYVSGAGQRAGAEAARTAVTISTYIQASNLYSSQPILQQRIAIDQAQAGLSRKLAALDLGDGAQDELGTAEVQAADSWSVIGTEMMRLPTTSDGIDPGLILAMSSTAGIWSGALHVQAAAADVSERAGEATNVFTLAATLAALATSLVTVALARPDSPVAVPLVGASLLDLVRRSKRLRGGLTMGCAVSVISCTPCWWRAPAFELRLLRTKISRPALLLRHKNYGYKETQARLGPLNNSQSVEVHHQ